MQHLSSQFAIFIPLHGGARLTGPSMVQRKDAGGVRDDANAPQGGSYD
jgi:hypothetical protein